MSAPTSPEARGEVLREVPAHARTSTRMGRFADAAERVAGRDLPDYAALWSWSTDEPEAFWRLVADELGMRWRTPPERYLADASMPGAVWCPGGTLNYAEHALAHAGDRPAVISRSQCRDEVVLSRDELRERVERCAAGLRRLGVGEGDAVAAYMPNIAETVVAFLATAALGATWASCAPEFGTRSVVDRLSQLRPDVLLVVDGYGYGEKAIDRTEEVAAIREELAAGGGPGGAGGGPGGAGGGPDHVVLLPYLDPDGAAARVPDAVLWDDLLAEHAPLDAVAVPFDHPLYVLFSSGTTGLPKPIVHGHGGITLEHLKSLALHFDLGEEDRFLWFSTTGWMMWNLLVSGLLTGSTIVLLDGDPAKPDLGALWRLAEETGLTVLGTSAPFLMACRKADVVPREEADLSLLRCVGSTGAPLPTEGFRWAYEAIADPRGERDLLLSSTSGGTDVCTSFVGGSPLLPVRAGEISGRCLGVRVEAYDAHGQPVIDEQGELVITGPMPSMPVGFLGDEDGSRYRESYFEDFPGVWRHGDWITIHEDGGCVISGRSDATLNRGGVRLGTAEFYAVVEDLDEVAESLVVHLEDDEGGAGELLLFVVPAGPDGAPADPTAVDRDALARTVAGELRAKLSPRHVPDALHLVPGVPKTLSGKKLEVPVKKVFTGTAVDDAASKGALANPEVLDAYDALADDRRR